MTTFWVVADQSRDSSGVYYRAFMDRLLAPWAHSDRRPGVHYLFENLDVFSFPERFTRKVGGRIRSSGSFDKSTDGVLLVFDSERDDYRACRERGTQLVESLSAVLGIEAVRIHVTVVVPMTESLYLFDDLSAKALREWVTAHSVHGPRGRRRAPVRAEIGSRVDELKRRRQHAARNPTTQMPTKDELYELVGTGVNKTDLARHMAAVLGRASPLPGVGLFPELDRLRGWVSALLST